MLDDGLQYSDVIHPSWVEIMRLNGETGDHFKSSAYCNSSLPFRFMNKRRKNGR